MRHWQPIHHARLRDFLAGLAAALRGESPVVATAPAPAPPPAPVAPPVSKIPLQPPPAPAPAPVAEPAAILEPAPQIAPPPPPAPPATSEPASSQPATPPPTSVLRSQVSGLSPSPSPSPSSAAPAAPAPGGARAFFASLGWTGGPRLTPAPTPSPAPALAAPRAAPIPTPVTAVVVTETSLRPEGSAAYFRALPWTGGSSAGEVVTAFRVTASRGDSTLDPRTASLPGDNPLLTGMLSAARTSDRLAAATPAPRPVSPARARAYFNTLPWAHA